MCGQMGAKLRRVVCASRPRRAARLDRFRGLSQGVDEARRPELGMLAEHPRSHSRGQGCRIRRPGPGLRLAGAGLDGDLLAGRPEHVRRPLGELRRTVVASEAATAIRVLKTGEPANGTGRSGCLSAARTTRTPASTKRRSACSKGPPSSGPRVTSNARTGANTKRALGATSSTVWTTVSVYSVTMSSRSAAPAATALWP
jgi:hypothetical protein